MDILPLVFTALGSALVTLLMCQLAHRRNHLAIPNSRSSHSKPTPTSGGVAILAIFLIYVIWYRYDAGVGEDLVVLTLLATGIGAIGYTDDRGHVAAGYRLLLHFLAAIVLVSMIDISTIKIVGESEINQWLVAAGGIVALVWLLNLFNFMDGIDGIAAVEAISVLVGACLILPSGGSTGFAEPMIALALCSFGFLVFNWPPAKIFMGDVGSGFLGMMLGGFSLITIAAGAISLWSWLILLAVFIVDATITLLRRALRGERVYQAHRSHAYQILSRRWQSHQKVTLLVLAVNLAWLLPLAWGAAQWPDLGVAMAVVAYLPLAIYVYRVGAGTTNN